MRRAWFLMMLVGVVACGGHAGFTASTNSATSVVPTTTAAPSTTSRPATTTTSAAPATTVASSTTTTASTAPPRPPAAQLVATLPLPFTADDIVEPGPPAVDATTHRVFVPIVQGQQLFLLTLDGSASPPAFAGPPVLVDAGDPKYVVGAVVDGPRQRLYVLEKLRLLTVDISGPSPVAVGQADLVGRATGLAFDPGLHRVVIGLGPPIDEPALVSFDTSVDPPARGAYFPDRDDPLELAIDPATHFVVFEGGGFGLPRTLGLVGLQADGSWGAPRYSDTGGSGVGQGLALDGRPLTPGGGHVVDFSDGDGAARIFQVTDTRGTYLAPVGDPVSLIEKNANQSALMAVDPALGVVVVSLPLGYRVGLYDLTAGFEPVVDDLQLPGPPGVKLGDVVFGQPAVDTENHRVYVPMSSMDRRPTYGLDVVQLS